MSDNISKYVAAISNKSNFDKVNEEKNKYDQEFANNHISNTLADMDINSHAENGVVRVYPQHVNKAKRVLSKLGYTHKVVGSLKEDLDESSNIRYNKDQFDIWKNQATIMGHKIRQATDLDGTFGDYYTAKDREGNFKGQFHKKLGGHLKEDLDEGFKYDVDHMVGNLGYRPISGQLETKKDNVYATYGTLERAHSVANKYGFIVKKHSYIDPYDKKTKFEYHVIKESLDLDEEHHQFEDDGKMTWSNWRNRAKKYGAIKFIDTDTHTHAYDKDGNRISSIKWSTKNDIKESLDLDEGYNQYNYNAKVAWRNRAKKYGAVNFKNTDTHTHAYDKDGNRISSFNKKTLEYTNKKVRNRINESLEDLTEEELMELDKKTLASYIKKAILNEFGPLYSPQRRDKPKSEKDYFERGDQWKPPKPPRKKKVQPNDPAPINKIKESDDKDVYGNPISAREKLYRNHQNIRKKAGLPDTNYYLELAKKKKQELEQMQDKVNK